VGVVVGEAEAAADQDHEPGAVDPPAGAALVAPGDVEPSAGGRDDGVGVSGHHCTT
jgi:hypothetical protein